MSDLIVIAGATGLVGAAAVDIALQRGWRVIALARNPAKLPARDGLETIAADFDDLAPLSGRLTAAAPKAFLCALGTTIRIAGSQAAFAKVDRDYVAAFAQLGIACGAQAFGLVSAVGASARSANFYLRVKGEAEDAARAAGYDHVEIARPSFLLGERLENRPGEGLATTVAQALSPLLLGPLTKYRPIPGADVARALVVGLEAPRRGLFVRHDADLRAMAQA
ncbi:MAG TPA: NAD(P)H-binding protein [Rhodoblastus sp.]|nr:NAD(P)H-binding protein [Rhodoblastus sp.]